MRELNSVEQTLVSGGHVNAPLPGLPDDLQPEGTVTGPWFQWDKDSNATGNSLLNGFFGGIGEAIADSIADFFRGGDRDGSTNVTVNVVDLGDLSFAGTENNTDAYIHGPTGAMLFDEGRNGSINFITSASGGVIWSR